MSRLSPLKRALGLRSHFEFDGDRRPPIETLDEAGAKTIKERIEEFWNERGYTVCVRIELGDFHPSARSRTFVVRSDLVDGWPREAER